MADASGLFDASFLREELIEYGCNMHARRYMVKALDAGDKRAALPLAAYKKLYEIEVEIRDRDPDATLVKKNSDASRSGTSSWCGVTYTISTSNRPRRSA